MPDDIETTEYDPLVFSRTMLQKMDALLPEMSGLLDAIREFKRGLGNGGWDAPWWPKSKMPVGGPGHE